MSSTTFFEVASSRPRRNRQSPAIRQLIEETTLRRSDLVMPFFVVDGYGQKEPIASLPQNFRWSIDLLLHEIAPLEDAGVQAIALFPVIDPGLKDAAGTAALQKENLILRAIAAVKEKFPRICLISDIALDPYTSHGHDGLVHDHKILNDETVDILSEMALLHAQAGADFVAPSDMMDGRVRAIRMKLDQNGFQDTGIIAYTAKYASSLYAPFREALGSSLSFGDKKSYQLNPANTSEALREAQLDELEGADVLMVKPALFYLDILAKIKERTHLPLCAYQVSGEYAMIMAADQLGFLEAQNIFYESLLGVKRAGASFIFTYATPMLIHSLSH